MHKNTACAFSEFQKHNLLFILLITLMWLDHFPLEFLNDSLKSGKLNFFPIILEIIASKQVSSCLKPLKMCKTIKRQYSPPARFCRNKLKDSGGGISFFLILKIFLKKSIMDATAGHWKYSKCRYFKCLMSTNSSAFSQITNYILKLLKMCKTKFCPLKRQYRPPARFCRNK